MQYGVVCVKTTRKKVGNFEKIFVRYTELHFFSCSQDLQVSESEIGQQSSKNFEHNETGNPVFLLNFVPYVT